jgi:hypothetical protein
MAARRRRKTAEQDSDYDGAWKEVLRQYLRQILEMYLPAIAAAIDWRHPPQWSDKDLGRIKHGDPMRTSSGWGTSRPACVSRSVEHTHELRRVLRLLSFSSISCVCASIAVSAFVAKGAAR